MLSRSRRPPSCACPLAQHSEQCWPDCTASCICVLPSSRLHKIHVLCCALRRDAARDSNEGSICHQPHAHASPPPFWAHVVFHDSSLLAHLLTYLLTYLPTMKDICPKNATPPLGMDRYGRVSCVGDCVELKPYASLAGL